MEIDTPLILSLGNKGRFWSLSEVIQEFIWWRLGAPLRQQNWFLIHNKLEFSLKEIIVMKP